LFFLWACVTIDDAHAILHGSLTHHPADSAKSVHVDGSLLGFGSGLATPAPGQNQSKFTKILRAACKVCMQNCMGTVKIAMGLSREASVKRK